MTALGKLKSLLKLKPFIKKYNLLFWGGTIGMILCSLISTPVPYLIGNIMDKVLIKSKSFKELYVFIAIIALLYLTRYIVSIVSKYTFVKVSNLVVNEMRYSIMDKVIDLPMSYLSKTEKGYVQSRISECGSIGSIFSPAFIGIFLSIFDSLFAVITMIALNYKLSIVILLLVPVIFLSAKASAGELSKSTRHVLESGAVLNGECFEILNGIEDIKVLNGKDSHLKKFRSKLDGLIKNSIGQGKTMLLFMENITVINNFGSLIILLISGIMILHGGLTIGLYTTFSLYAAKVFGSAQGLASLEITIKPVCISIERLQELLDMEDENYGKKQHLNGEINSIKAENISFGYNENKNVIDSLSFELHKGDKVLIKGENGSGKSTLIKLLLGLYNPVSGNILYNNLSTSVLNSRSIREKIGIVSQNIFLFRGTVLDNILYGQNGKTRRDVEELIKRFKLEAYIDRLPAGLDTEINQNTSGISGGQMQVIAFIRAALSNKEIIILDEPVSNVDVETREIILRLLGEKNLSSILIIISHQTEDMGFIERTIDLDSMAKSA
jgi:ABC-type multidrug transport system, ATPase and permease components